METKASNGLIVRYLLGDLPEEEQVRLEDQAFADREFLRTVEDAENDLIDEYVHGTLTEVERQQFESRFLASAERQQKVEFARALARVTTATQGEAKQPAAAPLHWWDSLRVFFSGLHPVFQFSLAAAALLLVIGVSWLVLQTIRLRDQVAQLQAQQSSSSQTATQTEELQRQLAEQQKRNEELAQQLQDEQQQLAQLQKELTSTQTARPVIASLFLIPGLSRGSGTLPQLRLRPGMQQVRLQIGLEKGDDHRRFHVTLQTASGQVIQSQQNLSAQSTRAGRAVVFSFPARLLSQGEYELMLKGVTEQGTSEDIGYYYFRVLR